MKLFATILIILGITLITFLCISAIETRRQNQLALVEKMTENQSMLVRQSETRQLSVAEFSTLSLDQKIQVIHNYELKKSK